MDADLEVTMKRVHPFGTRITVSPSSVDEEQRQSGLIVPIHDESGQPVPRGVILDAGEASLCAGDVVYYQGGHKIGDVIVVDIANVIAYESDE